MQKIIRYPIGEQSFLQLRKGDFVYVDKTEYVAKLALGSRYYFLSRPRRFGKSLFLSTLKAFFQGRRELFKGLYVDSIDWDWAEYPVLHLDLNTMQYDKEGDIGEIFENFLLQHEREYGLCPNTKNHSSRFGDLIRHMSTKFGKGVVILIDEYDKPLVNNINHPERFERCRSALSAFYSNLKSSAEYIRLVFLTGVSRFGRVSVFSALNNISDISFDTEFSAICGITEDELKQNFKEGIESLADYSGRSCEEEIRQLKKHYDGYHFAGCCPDIYNPFSLLQVFAKRHYGNYWIESGTPTLLAELLKHEHSDLTELLGMRCDKSTLQSLDINRLTPESLLYQTGYLTIKDYNPRRDMYTINLPNEEVKKGFFDFLLPYYANIEEKRVRILVYDLVDDLEDGKADAFMKRLQAMFAGIGYDLKFDDERNVQNAMVILTTLLGLEIEAEYKTSDGGIDLLMRTERYVYIMELKYNRSASEALQQIEDKEYALPWAVDERKVIGVGINYSLDSRRIDSWETKQLRP